MMIKTICLPITTLFLVCACAEAADSTLSISGYVRDNSCEVATSSQNFVVDLMNNPAKQFHSVGAVTTRVPFQIVLSACGSAATAVKVSFTGTADTDNSSVLKIDAGREQAAGIGIQLFDNKHETMVINPDTSSIAWTKLAAGQTNTLNFYARLMATRIPVTAGHVNAMATFTLEFQ